MIEFISQPWSWWFSGIMISLVMFLMIFSGETFAFSSNLRTICTLAGAGKKVKFFDISWKDQAWNLVFLVGAIIGGYIAHTFLSSPEPVQIAASTIQDISNLGFAAPSGMQPEELFSMAAVATMKGFSLLALAGFMIGFGTRYAGGCTSGHAISGLSNLQVPSLISVIGFFTGGLIMTFFIFPLIF